MRRPNSLICLFICFFILNSFLNLSVMAKEKKDPLSGNSFYDRAIDYLHAQRKTKQPVNGLGLRDYSVLATIDLFLSLFCIWSAILLVTGNRTLRIKADLWFLFISNLCWFICLLLFNLFWRSLDFLIFDAQPELKPAFIDNFSLFVIVFAVLIYIWLLARTFNLDFSDSLNVFFFSHLFYFLIIFLFFHVVNVQKNRYFDFSKENFGIGPVIKSYFLDVNKISTGQGLVSFIRIRPFRI